MQGKGILKTAINVRVMEHKTAAVKPEHYALGKDGSGEEQSRELNSINGLEDSEKITHKVEQTQKKWKIGRRDKVISGLIQKVHSLSNRSCRKR